MRTWNNFAYAYTSICNRVKVERWRIEHQMSLCTYIFNFFKAKFICSIFSPQWNLLKPFYFRGGQPGLIILEFYESHILNSADFWGKHWRNTEYLKHYIYKQIHVSFVWTPCHIALTSHTDNKLKHFHCFCIKFMNIWDAWPHEINNGNDQHIWTHLMTFSHAALRLNCPFHSLPDHYSMPSLSCSSGDCL